MAMQRDKTADQLQKNCAYQASTWREIEEIALKRQDKSIFIASDDLPSHLDELKQFRRIEEDFRAIGTPKNSEEVDVLEECIRNMGVVFSSHVYFFDTQALASWRPTQGIYRLDADFAMALIETQHTGELPVSILNSIPEWCLYIEFNPCALFCNGDEARANEMQEAQERPGCFVRFDQFNGQRYLCFRYAISGELGRELPSLKMTPGRTLAEALDESRANVWGTPEDHGIHRSVENDMQIVGAFLNAVIYICSANADVVSRRSGIHPSRPKPTMTKRGPRFFPPDQPVTWECGYRIGTVIRAARREEEIRRAQGGTHSAPIPHVRRAHWHRFWTGKKAKPGQPQPTERELIVKWLHPILVNAGEESPVPVLHRVAPPLESVQ